MKSVFDFISKDVKRCEKLNKMISESEKLSSGKHRREVNHPWTTFVKPSPRNLRVVGTLVLFEFCIIPRTTAAKELWCDDCL